MTRTRRPGRTDGVAERLRRLDAREFRAFCASLWAARGYETRVDGDRVLAARDGERVVVLPRTRPGPAGRAAATLARWAGHDADAGADAEAVDVVATAAGGAWGARLAARHDARLVGPDALADLLLYGVPRAEADAVAVRHLGVATATTLARRSAGPDAADDDPPDRGLPAPPAVVAVAGLVCLVLAAAVAGVWVPGGGDSGRVLGSAAAPGPGGESVPVPAAAASDPGAAGTAGPPSPPMAGYPPGVGDDWLDPETLARAHVAAVENRSYRLVVRQSDTRAVGGDRRWDGVWQHSVVESDRVWLYSVVGYESTPNGSDLVQYTLYADGESVYRRADLRDGAGYDREPLPPVGDDGVGQPADRARLYLLRYLGTDVTVDQPSWSPDLYRVVATDRPAGVDGPVSNYTATAFVDESGFVSELTVEYTRVVDGDPREIRFRMEYAAVGEATVLTPGWYDEARAATGASPTSVPATEGTERNGTATDGRPADETATDGTATPTPGPPTPPGANGTATRTPADP